MTNDRKVAVLEKLAGLVDGAGKLAKKLRPKKAPKSSDLSPEERAKTVSALKEALKKGDAKVVKGIFDY